MEEKQVLVELAVKHQQGHWVISTILWPEDELEELSFEKYIILRRIDFSEYKIHEKNT